MSRVLFFTAEGGPRETCPARGGWERFPRGGRGGRGEKLHLTRLSVHPGFVASGWLKSMATVPPSPQERYRGPRRWTVAAPAPAPASHADDLGQLALDTHVRVC